jgi:uncharacterized membrane protein
MLLRDEIQHITSRGHQMKGLYLALVPALLLILVVAQTVPGGQGPAVTYTISLGKDGSATWNMEYRTPLLSAADLAAFQDYSDRIQAESLPDFTGLMRRSAAEASVATGRPVTVSDFTADGAVQSGPTGSYGVVHYRCRWSGFAEPGDSLTVGDVFVGGLYLGKDHALILRPPPGFSVGEVSPPPDRTQDGLTWYGLRSFGAGKPRVVLTEGQVPWLPMLLVLGVAGLALGIYASRRRRTPASLPGPAPDTAAAPVDTGADLELGDRIVALLEEKGGTFPQAGIVETLGLPKSTVSEAVNRLHEAGRIEKVRKGRENLIRLR